MTEAKKREMIAAMQVKERKEFIRSLQRRHLIGETLRAGNYYTFSAFGALQERRACEDDIREALEGI